MNHFLHLLTRADAAERMRVVQELNETHVAEIFRRLTFQVPQQELLVRIVVKFVQNGVEHPLVVAIAGQRIPLQVDPVGNSTPIRKVHRDRQQLVEAQVELAQVNAFKRRVVDLDEVLVVRDVNVNADASRAVLDPHQVGERASLESLKVRQMVQRDRAQSCFIREVNGRELVPVEDQISQQRRHRVQALRHRREVIVAQVESLKFEELRVGQMFNHVVRHVQRSQPIHLGVLRENVFKAVELKLQLVQVLREVRQRPGDQLVVRKREDLNRVGQFDVHPSDEVEGQVEQLQRLEGREGILIDVGDFVVRQVDRFPKMKIWI